jgi:hypothetical protein
MIITTIITTVVIIITIYSIIIITTMTRCRIWKLIMIREVAPAGCLCPHQHTCQHADHRQTCGHPPRPMYGALWYQAPTRVC